MPVSMVSLHARTIEQYERTFLKEQFLASLSDRQWVERDEGIRAFAPEDLAEPR